MADEVVNRLGFDVSQALEALARLDTALKGIGGSLAGFGSALAAWSTKGATAVSVMRDLASAAQRTATAMAKMATPAATTAPTSQLWLPPGVQSSAQQAATAMTTVGTAAQEAGQKAATAMTQAGQATNQAAEHTKGLTISWQTLARVVMTQLIVRTISMIRDALKEAVTASLEFQVQIAEIQTIAPRFGENFASSMATSRESLTREVAEFSKAFNIPLPKVAEGLYQTISNQFTKITDRMNVMNAAAALSKVGVMDFDKAILLLTGTLNAYGMASSQADTIAVKFYETIRLGRIRGEELAATYGQVAPIARELGVSINELNAAVVSMTIGGLDAHKTMTALRGVMMAFLKPSEELKRVTHGMGFTDPTQLIAAKGLQGAIQAISDAADGMGVKIAESVRNVRAILAELRLSSAEGAKKYQEALKAMDEATPENLAKILAEFRSTDAEKLTASINRLKVALTQDFGSILVKSLGDIMKFVGGAEQMAAVLTGIAAAAGAAVVAIAAISVALVALHFAAGPAGIALLAVGAIVAGIAGGVGLSAYTDMFAIGKIRKDAEAARKIIFDAMKQQQADIATWRTAADAENQATVADWQTRAAAIRGPYFVALDELKRKNEETIQSSRQVMESMIATQERLVGAYAAAAAAALRLSEDSAKRQQSTWDAYNDRKAQNDIREAERSGRSADAMGMLQNRAYALSRQAYAEMLAAKTADEAAAAENTFQRARALAQQLDALALKGGGGSDLAQAQKVLLDILLAQVEAEGKLAKLSAERALAVANQTAAERENLNKMKALVPEILKDLEAFDKGEPKSPAALKAQEDRLKQNVAALRDLYLGGKKVDVGELLNLDQLSRRVALALEGGVSKAQLKEFDLTAVDFAKVRKQIEDGIGPIKIWIQETKKMNPELTEATRGMPAKEQVAYFGKRLGEDLKTKLDYEEAVKQFAVAQTAVEQFLYNAEEGFKSFSKLPVPELVGKELTPAANTAIKSAVDNLAAAKTQFFATATPSSEDMRRLLGAYNQYLEIVNPNVKARELLAQMITDAQAAVSQVNAAKAYHETLDSGRMKYIRAMQEVGDLQRGLLRATEEADRLKEGAQGAAQGASTAKTALMDTSQIDMSGLTQGIWGAVDAVNALTNAAYSVPSMGATMAALGGKVYLAGGGMPRGTDVIPAMLSPGEVVINAESARRFSAQLTAMNAGVRPVFRNDGGSVTNVGDINVSVTGGGSSRQTARSIASELRRELRRGTSTL